MENYSDETIICYCSHISIGEIKQAIKNNCNTIEDVRSFLDKHITGNCNIKSPNKKCCHQSFNQIISALKK